jgi:hypothetical protein
MKKRTVITTEKRELWFIRPSLESNQESDDENVRPRGYENELMALLDQPWETADSSNDEEREFTEGEVDHVS